MLSYPDEQADRTDWEVIREERKRNPTAVVGIGLGVVAFLGAVAWAVTRPKVKPVLRVQPVGGLR